MMQIYQDYAAVKEAYTRIAEEAIRLKAQVAALIDERNAATDRADAACLERDRARDAWQAAQAQIAREQERTRDSFRAARRASRSAQQYQSVIRACMSPEEWLEAQERARAIYPDVWSREE